jgi:hypothetical protein
VDDYVTTQLLSPARRKQLILPGPATYAIGIAVDAPLEGERAPYSIVEYTVLP